MHDLFFTESNGCDYIGDFGIQYYDAVLRKQIHYFEPGFTVPVAYFDLDYCVGAFYNELNQIIFEFKIGMKVFPVDSRPKIY